MDHFIYKINGIENFDAGVPQGSPRPAIALNRWAWVEKWGVPLLLLMDLLGWILAMTGAVLFFRENALYFSFLWIGPVFGSIALYLIGSYDRRADFISLDYFSEHLIGITFAAAFSMLFAYVFPTFSFAVKPSRLFIPALFTFFCFISICSRRLLGQHLLKQHINSTFLVLGSAGEAFAFAHLYGESGFDRRLEFAFWDPEEEPAASAERTVNENEVLTKLLNTEANYAAVLLACNTDFLPAQWLQRLIQLHCSGIHVLTMDSFRERYRHRVSAASVGPAWLFDAEFKLAHDSFYSHVKRLIDLAIAGSALLILAPFLLLVALLIRLESPGSPIFKQERVGREGRVFTMFKFRTMRENRGAGTTTKSDGRITRIGRLLRITRLDELLQLWNVLANEMSLIGPRAEWVKCAEIYEKEIPHYHIRHLIKPGITGWAQVKFRYGENTSDAIEKFEYDLYYIRNFSSELDLRIVIKTIHTMLCGNGR